MRTLLISDLHLGTRMRRDVLRRDVALDRLVTALDDVDRLVLLGDTVEMLRPGGEGSLDDIAELLRLDDKQGRQTSAAIQSALA